MKLSQAGVGGKYVIESIDLDDRIKNRLEILGMVRRTEIEVLNRKKNTGVVIRVRSTRFAIGRKFADKIEVRKKRDE